MEKTICVCGAGTMGSGIAHLAASSGFRTILFDVREDGLRKAAAQIRNNLEMLVNKSKLAADDADTIMSRLSFTSNVNDCVAHIIIEAIIEDLSAKQKLFSQLCNINDRSTIFTSNTSSLAIQTIAETMPNRDKVAGLHFFNPAPVMKLVEIVRTTETSDETIEMLRQTAWQMGKETVVCNDSPGFIVNHVARPFYLEALKLKEFENIEIESIDSLITASGFKMGPFRLMDLIGNDINYAVSVSVYEALDRPARLKPSLLQQQMVATGKLGKKSGEGYYNY